MNEQIAKQKVIDFLKKEMWYPSNPTNVELETSILLNTILADIISRFVKE